jgi:hypothetical protein
MASAPAATTTVIKLGFQAPPALFNPDVVAYAFFFVVAFVAVIFTLVVAYHWVRYGHRSPLSIPALALHIFVATGLLLFAASGLP